MWPSCVTTCGNSAYLLTSLHCSFSSQRPTYSYPSLFNNVARLKGHEQDPDESRRSKACGHDVSLDTESTSTRGLLTNINRSAIVLALLISWFLLGGTLSSESTVMGSTNEETYKAKYEYETVKGVFLQDDPKTDWKEFEYVRNLSSHSKERIG